MYAGPQRRPPSAGRTFLEREGQPRWRSRRCTSRWCSPRGSCGRTEANRCASEPRPREACASLRGVDIFGGDSRAASRADDPRILRATRDSLTLTSPSCRFLPRRCTCADPSPTGWKRFHGPRAHPRGRPGFRGVCNLPPGYHQYKFIVDGEWRHDENQAFIQDPLGNVNNWCARRSTRSRRDPRRPRPRRLPDLFGEKQPRLVFPSRGSLPSLNLISLPRLLSPSPLLDLRLFVKKPGTSNDGTGGQAIPIPQAQQTGAGGDSGMD